MYKIAVINNLNAKATNASKEFALDFWNRQIKENAK